MFRKQRKLEDGDEIDIDDVIEAIVDIRTGSSPSDKLYWRRNKVQRDVAVVFLLDTSASTAEAVDDSRKGEDWDAPDDPVEYMTWLRTRRGDGMRRSYKRIIDLEKEACVLLINALEAVGDRYGIYAFSGYGRENVEFYTIKDIEENFSDSIKTTDRSHLAPPRDAHGACHPSRDVQAGRAGGQDEAPVPHQRRQAAGQGLQPRREWRRSTPSTTRRWPSTRPRPRTSRPSRSPSTRTATTT